MVNPNTCLSGRGGVGHPEGVRLEGGLTRQLKGNTGSTKRGGEPNIAREEWRKPHKNTIERVFLQRRGGRPLHKGRRGIEGLYPYEGAPVVAGGL